jgi:hypothetical protein
MTNGGNQDNKVNKLRLQRILADDNRCTFCPPHRDENDKGTYHNRFYATVDGVPKPRKRKAVK